MRANHLIRLLADNRKAPRRFEAQASGDEATIYLYDVIVSDALTAEYWGGVAPEPFAKQLAAIDAKVIHLRINSPGGDVFAARAMMQALAEHPARIIAHIDGYAASAATVLAMAADEIEIAQGAFFMIHNSWTVAFGNADDLLSTAALLEKVDGTIADSYAKRTGKPMDDIRAWMDAETWFTAQEAVDNGFADRVAEEAPHAKAGWNVSAYDKAPAPSPMEGLQQIAAQCLEAAAKLVAAAGVATAADPDHEHRGRRLALAQRTA
jgi:ATP-dependent Clp protease protease subunit